MALVCIRTSYSEPSSANCISEGQADIMSTSSALLSSFSTP